MIRLASVVLSLGLFAAGAPAENGTAAAPVAAVRRHSAFRFEAHDDGGEPVRWDPCGAIDLRFNRALAPMGARRQLQEAVSVIRHATGLRIRLVGNTTTRPSARYGDAESVGRWPVVLVAFVWPGAHLLSDPGASAETTTWVAGEDGRLRYVTGMLLMNAAQNHLYNHDSGTGASRIRLFEHELGHLVGLDHVEDRHSIMYPRVLRRTGLTRGDRRGLRALGPAGDPDSRCP